MQPQSKVKIIKGLAVFDSRSKPLKAYRECVKNQQSYWLVSALDCLDQREQKNNASGLKAFQCFRLHRQGHRL